MKRTATFFLVATILSSLLITPAFAKVMEIKGPGFVQHKPCPAADSEYHWPPYWEQTSYCIYVYIDGLEKFYYTIPGKHSDLDLLPENVRANFHFWVVDWKEGGSIEEGNNELYQAEVYLSLLPLPKADFDDPVLEEFYRYENPFPDTDIMKFGGKAAAELYRRTIVSGYEYAESKYPEGSFLGDRQVNRAEGAKFLLRTKFGDIEKETALDGNGGFPDVLESEWYGKYVVKAAKEDIINGYPDGTFRPERSINRVEFLKMMTIAFDLPKNLPHTFVDIEPGAWYTKYVGIVERYNLFPGRIVNSPSFPVLRPGFPMTRNEVAVALYQYLRLRDDPCCR